MKDGYRNSNHELDLSTEQPEPPLRTHGSRQKGKGGERQAAVYSGVFEYEGRWHARISDPYSNTLAASMDLGSYPTKKEAIAAYWVADDLYSQLMGMDDTLDGNSIPEVEYDSREFDDLGDGCFIRTQKPGHE